MASELTKPFEEKMKKTLTALDSLRQIVVP